MRRTGMGPKSHAIFRIPRNVLKRPLQSHKATHASETCPRTLAGTPTSLAPELTDSAYLKWSNSVTVISSLVEKHQVVAAVRLSLQLTQEFLGRANITCTEPVQRLCHVIICHSELDEWWCLFESLLALATTNSRVVAFCTGWSCVALLRSHVTSLLPQDIVLSLINARNHTSGRLFHELRSKMLLMVVANSQFARLEPGPLVALESSAQVQPLDYSDPSVFDIYVDAFLSESGLVSELCCNWAGSVALDSARQAFLTRFPDLMREFRARLEEEHEIERAIRPA